jgi:hypothetical protein
LANSPWLPNLASFLWKSGISMGPVQGIGQIRPIPEPHHGSHSELVLKKRKKKGAGEDSNTIPKGDKCFIYLGCLLKYSKLAAHIDRVVNTVTNKLRDCWRQ